MKQYFISTYKILAMNGIDLIKVFKAVKEIPFYLKDLRRFKSERKESKVDFMIQQWPCLGDKFSEGGDIKGHYFHQDLLVARKIYNKSPKRHVDIGSRIDGFVAHVASYREIEVFDIRVITSNVPNVKFVQCDLMMPIDNALTDYCDSLSCLHALEHFGLGRYGDPINYTGYLDGLVHFHKILKSNGTLYLSVPIGEQRVEFNAHRVFSMKYLTSILLKMFTLIEFSYIDDDGKLHEAISWKEGIADNFGCNFGCAIFELKNNK